VTPDVGFKVGDANEVMMTKWARLQRYVSVRRQGRRDGKAIDTTTFYLTSKPLSAGCLAQIIRHHRKIETPLHWPKDVVPNEEACGLVNPQAAINLAVIRNIRFNWLVMNGFKSISEGISAMGDNILALWKIISCGDQASA
jgi:predicted transposase YbfD/YdcC